MVLTVDKFQSGTAGFDYVTGGGLPKNRAILVTGGPGCGKSLFAMSAAAHGATALARSAVVTSFEESADEIVANAASIGIDLQTLIDDGKLIVDFAAPPETQTVEIGEYDLDGLILRLDHNVSKIDAKLVVIDTIESLFTMFEDVRTIRAELNRLFRWLKRRDVSVIITGEQGGTTLTRFGLEEYVSDCVICLDHRVNDNTSTRRLRIVKYRGAAHETNEFPFIIGDDGLTVMPITSAVLDHHAGKTFISTGFERLDRALGGRGLRRASTVFISGLSGSGKTNLATAIAAAAKARGERVLYYSFEQSPDELRHNALSIGIDLPEDGDADGFALIAVRPTLRGLERHLVETYRDLSRLKPTLAVFDPIDSFSQAGTVAESYRMLVRLVDTLKRRHITAVLTAVTHDTPTSTDLAISSIIDTWMHLSPAQRASHTKRELEILKARGADHDAVPLPFEITSNGFVFGLDPDG